MAEDAYAILGVAPTAPASVIRAAYKARIRDTHPDTGGDADEARAVNDAYAIVGDENRRREYDRGRPDPSPQGPPAASRRPQPNASSVPVPVPPTGRSSASPHSQWSRVPPPAPWWRRTVVAVAAGAAVLSLVYAAILIAIGAYSVLPTLFAVATSVLAIACALGERRAILVAVIAAVAGIAFLPSDFGLGFLAAVMLWARTSTARSRELHAADTVFTTASAHQLAVEQVLVTEIHSGVTVVELAEVDTGRVATIALRGRFDVGDYLVRNGPDILARVSAAGATRYVRRFP